MRVVKKKKRFTLRKLWQLRYRVYAIIVILILTPVLYASDKDIPENISVEGFGYEVIDNNLLASKIQRIKLENVENTGDLEGDIASGGIPDKPLTPEEQERLDKIGYVITEQLKRESGIDMGFIYSQPFVDLGKPIKVSDKDIANVPKDAIISQKPLEQVVPKPAQKTNFRNILIYEKYKIRVPVIYTTFDDLFYKNPDGTYNRTKSGVRDTSDINSPVQVKLQKGIVHLAYSPQPGEIGNCYIIGHSSNYSFVKSPYNTVFKPIEQISKPGEEFIIYDRHGRKLKFRVFETKKIAENDTAEAYKRYPDKRVCTLQTSILGWKDGRIQATHRWLTRGELIVE